MELKEIRLQSVDQSYLTHDTIQWQAFECTVMNGWIRKKTGTFLTC